MFDGRFLIIPEIIPAKSAQRIALNAISGRIFLQSRTKGMAHKLRILNL